MSSTILDIMRHGEPEGGRMYRGGGTDHTLSKAGWQQMRNSLQGIDPDWSAIVSSPMRRCREFALDLARQKNLPCEVLEKLREAGYGTWEGKTPRQLIAEDETAYWQFFEDPVNARPANAEPLASFTERVEQALNHVLETYQGEHILLVSHLAVTRAMIGIVLGMPLASQQRIDMPFAGTLRLINDRKGLRLLF